MMRKVKSAPNLQSLSDGRSSSLSSSLVPSRNAQLLGHGHPKAKHAAAGDASMTRSRGSKGVCTAFLPTLMDFTSSTASAAAEAVEEVVVELSQGRGIAAGDCFLAYGITPDELRAGAAPSLRESSSSPELRGQAQGLSQSDQDRARMVASCLATPSGEEENIGEALRARISRLFMQTEIELEQKYEEEMSRAGLEEGRAAANQAAAGYTTRRRRRNALYPELDDVEQLSLSTSLPATGPSPPAKLPPVPVASCPETKGALSNITNLENPANTRPLPESRAAAVASVADAFASQDFDEALLLAVDAPQGQGGAVSAPAGSAVAKKPAAVSPKGPLDAAQFENNIRPFRRATSQLKRDMAAKGGK